MGNESSSSSGAGDLKQRIIQGIVRTVETNPLNLPRGMVPTQSSTPFEELRQAVSVARKQLEIQQNEYGAVGTKVKRLEVELRQKCLSIESMALKRNLPLEIRKKQVETHPEVLSLTARLKEERAYMTVVHTRVDKANKRLTELEQMQSNMRYLASEQAMAKRIQPVMQSLREEKLDSDQVAEEIGDAENDMDDLGDALATASRGLTQKIEDDASVQSVDRWHSAVVSDLWQPTLTEAEIRERDALEQALKKKTTTTVRLRNIVPEEPPVAVAPATAAVPVANAKRPPHQPPTGFAVLAAEL